MSRNGPWAIAYHTLFVAFMLAPIVVVCWVAFTPEGYLSFPTDRWSLRWFTAIGRYPEFISAFWRSLWLGALSSAIAVAVSVPAALAIARYRFPGREAMTTLFMSPLMIPHVVLGIACGSTIRRSTVNGPAPSATAAFSICGSSRCSAAHTASTM